MLWVEFPVQTGLGEGTMALRLQGEEIRLPLGARSGEFDLTLQRDPEPPGDDEIAAAAAQAAAAVERERAAWAAGAFLLKDRRETVGEVRFHGAEGAAMVSVHDTTWLTPEPATARRLDDGGDVLLSFPVEPSLEGEDGLLRVNLLTRSVVVPSGPVPDKAVDRRLGLVPGRLTAEARQAAVEAAVAATDAAERELLEEQAGALAEVAAERGGGCTSLAELGEPWTNLLAGYEVEIVTAEGGGGAGCAVRLAPVVSQHRRRFEGVMPEPAVEVEDSAP